MQRRLLLAAGVLGLSGCGFRLREAPDFAFDSIAIPGSTSGVAAQLRRTLSGSGGVRVLAAGEAPSQAQVVLDILAEQREKVVVGLNATGQVREFQLRTRFKFRLRTPQGRELIPDTELVQERDVSFNESAVLAKEAEEGLLYRDMQNDLVQQLMRRLAAVKSL
ncbi:LPS assembly lipoprotein LptE [Ramlibacter tataouinensis]|uniref:LPS-assembly lipoprotein LptE n=1 Tax=Ramlibacter tataouinensis TaxID=94132 RepID=UPI0022F39C54|nr:LPS assembly lipoprotein LptE [Ramlibacter tataouinensis]WBY03886.1 LPS assembly lipoprotein LptE [Ramlibacter tataouinensis]